MKKLFMISALFFALSLGTAHSQAPAKGPETLTLEIKGMTCPMCATKIESSIKKLGTNTKCSVDEKAGKAVVEYDPSQVSPEQILETCNKSGFKCQKI